MAELEIVITNLKKLAAVRDSIEPKIKQIRKSGDDALDNDRLSKLITEVMAVLEELEKADNSAAQLNLRLKAIKANIGDADIPELVQ